MKSFFEGINRNTVEYYRLTMTLEEQAERVKNAYLLISDTGRQHLFAAAEMFTQERTGQPSFAE